MIWNDFYASGNLTIYYSPEQIRSRDFGDQTFRCTGNAAPTSQKLGGLGRDGKYPNLIVEILSDSTAAIDRGLKKQLYQVHSARLTTSGLTSNPRICWFHSRDGQYQPLEPNSQGWLWSQQ